MTTGGTPVESSASIRDRFPKEIDHSGNFIYDTERVYAFDISYWTNSSDELLKPHNAQFVVEKRIIIRPFYSHQSRSIESRERMADDFLEYIYIYI